MDQPFIQCHRTSKPGHIPTITFLIFIMSNTMTLWLIQFPDEEYADQRSKIKKVRMKTQQRRIVHQNLMLVTFSLFFQAFFQIHMRMSFISITGNQIDLFIPQTDQTICGL